MRTIFSAFTGVLVSVALWSPATAASDPVHYLDPAAFHALGVIDQVTNFDTFPEAVPTFLSNPYVEGDLFITSTGNICDRKRHAAVFSGSEFYHKQQCW